MEIAKEERNWLRSFAGDLEYLRTKSKRGKIWIADSLARDWIFHLKKLVGEIK